MAAYQSLKKQLLSDPSVWLVTGVAGFIGSNILEVLLKLNQRVIGLDNLSTGHRANLEDVRSLTTPEQWANFSFIEGDIRNFEACRTACQGVQYVLHHAAIGSVPRSIDDPIAVNQNNVDGFLNMLVASRDAKVRRLVYAASSAIYGDLLDLPKVEDNIGKPLSPYAVTKLINELYADVFARTYSIESVGLRYFNIFGRRQDPNGPYAAVIPKWISAMINDEPIYIHGDGETSRDFCYVDDAVQANLLAATTTNIAATNQVYNVAIGEKTSLNQLYFQLRDNLVERFAHLKDARPVYRDFRSGDIRHSVANICKGNAFIGYKPIYGLREALRETTNWYVNKSSTSKEK